MQDVRFVLIHGAWHGGWCWRDVCDQLEDAGYAAYAPTLPGLSERADLMSRELTLTAMVEDVVAYLAERDLKNVVLVGHSFAGTVITGVADRVRDRLHSLVFLDAAVILDGETAFDTVPSSIADQRRVAASAFDGGLSMPPPPGEALGLGPSEQWAIDRLSPHPLASYESTLSLAHPVGNGLPTRYVALEPAYPALTLSRERAAALGWPTRTMRSGHDAMILAPAETTAILLDGLGAPRLTER